MASPRLLVPILEEARALLLRPANDFSWSSWNDGEHAATEIDGILEWLRRGEMPIGFGLDVIFAPTGPMQEVSLSSGWGDEFGDLADRFDRAMAATDCPCFASATSERELVRNYELDDHFGETSLHRCKLCGQHWLRYHYENEGFTGSGRWYLGALTAEARSQLDGTNGKEVLESLPSYFVGGSYLGGNVAVASGEIRLD
ncbi:MAG: hypothetical protein ABL962_05205 [Fimbriimonadaceae bacterium]